MTKKDYEMIAAVIKLDYNFFERMQRDNRLEQESKHDYRQMQVGSRLLITDLAEELAKDNERFDRARFLAACGIED